MNQAKRRAEPTAADGVAPVDVDAGDANVQEEGMAGPSNAPTMPGKGGNVQNFKELAPAAKPEMKYTKRSKERDEIQLKMLSLLQQENVPPPQQKDDYLDLAFASIAERMRVRMTPDQQEDLLMDINQVVNEAFHQLRRGKSPQDATSTAAAPRCDLPDMGIVQGGQQFQSANIPPSSNEMYRPGQLNQPQFQGFSYMNL